MKTLFIAIVMVLSFAMPASSTILFYEDFEAALDFANDWKLSGEHGSHELTVEQVRYGTQAYKFSLTRHDAEDYREELTLISKFNAGNYNFSVGSEYWIGFSIFLANGYQSPSAGGIVHQQYHGQPDHPPTCDPTEDWRHPNISIIGGKVGEWYFVSRSDSAQCTPNGSYDETHFIYYGAFLTGQWVDYVINVKWDYGGNGFIKVWKNGVLKINLANAGTCFNDDNGPYLKIGIYSHSLDQDQTITIYYDELRIGDSNSSYSEVAPGGDPPPSFPNGWGRKCILEIQADKIDANQGNFPVLLTENTLPLEMFDADGSYPALNGGGDIRFSSDIAGNTQLSCEVVTFTIDNNPANGVAEIWVKVPSISSSSNTTIYVWYNKSGVSQPAADATYGSESVWDANFKLVQHMSEDPSGSSPQMIDTTSNNNDGISGGTMTSADLVAGKIGKALDFDGSDDRIAVSHDASIDFADEDFTISIWFRTDTAKISNYIFSKNYGGNGIKWYGINLDAESQYLRGYIDDGTINSQVGATDDFNDNAWHQIVLQRNTTTDKVILYIDGVWNAEVNDTSASIANTGNLVFGGRADLNNTRFWTDLLDEFHISGGIRSATWIKAEYNNQNDPATFVIEGTPGAEWIIDHFMMMGM